jgi:hypothetical protein
MTTYFVRFNKSIQPKAWLVCLIIATLMIEICGSFLLGNGQASALSGSTFQAGDIIDNGVFFDGSTMSSGDVQNFLSSKAPSCDTSGSQMYNSTQTRAQYGASQGYPAPYTCLKDYRQDTPNMAAESSICAAFQAGNRSAAQIIRDTASACGINPQVLIVLLQKEQSLITDDWPWPTEYNSATGFGCPDTAPCDTSYAGFFYQVYYAARQFKAYAVHANQYGYFANSNNSIGYNPSSSCGSSNVYLQNQATTNLYIYTPYQPNAAALNNLYGSGDSCSAYGNRNFWRIFNDWFGSTHAAPFSWQSLSQGAFADAANTIPINTAALAPNTTYYLHLKVENMGNSIWHNSGGPANNQVNLAVYDNSKFTNSSWLSPSRAATPNEATIFPGGMATFDFSVTTPSGYSSQNEYFNLVAEGQTWMNNVGLYWPMNVLPPTALWQLASQEAFYDSGRTQQINLSALAPNTTYYLRVKALNTGNTTWTNSGANPMRLGTSSPQDRASSVADNSWVSSSRAAILQEASVVPGSTGTFLYSIRTPNSYGAYNEYFRPVVDGVSWLQDIGMYYPLNVVPPTYQWQLVKQNLYTDSSQASPANASAISNRGRVYAVMNVMNTGNTTWTNSGANPMRLGTSSPQDRASAFYDPSWLSSNRVAALQESSVPPGSTGTFAFWMQAPYAANGTAYKEYFRPVVDGVSWLQDIGMYYGLTMQSGSTLSWGVQSQNAYTDPALTNPINTTQLKTNTVYYLQLKIKNTGGTVWTNANFNLGTSNPQNRVSAFAYNWLTNNRPARLSENSVQPGGTGTFTFSIKTPAQATNTSEYFEPVIDGTAWLPDMGLYWPITTTP